MDPSLNIFTPKPEDVSPEEAAKFVPPVMDLSDAGDLAFRPTIDLPAEESTVTAPDAAGTALAVPTTVDAQGDLTHVQGNLKQLIQTGNQAVRDLYSLAKQTDHPRAYESLTLLIQTVANVNKDLIEFHERKNKLEAQGQGIGQPTNVTNNTLAFVGSTSDFQKMLQEVRDNGSSGKIV